MTNTQGNKPISASPSNPKDNIPTIPIRQEYPNIRIQDLDAILGAHRKLKALYDSMPIGYVPLFPIRETKQAPEIKGLHAPPAE